MFSAEPVCSCAPFLRPYARETAGAARIRHSLLPHLGDNETQTSGVLCRENAEAYLLFENLNSRGAAAVMIERAGGRLSLHNSRPGLWVPARRPGRRGERA